MKWEPVDIIVLILVVFAGILLGIEQTAPLITDEAGVAETTKIVNHAVGAMLAIISMYVGSKLGKKKKEDNEV